jgi:F-type H+-transporting ATPase subunit gamma
VASLKVIRKRIASVRSTQQVTKAMKMVAAAKLRRAQERAEHARAYSDRLAAVLQRLAGVAGAGSHPFLAAGGEGPPHLIVVTGDRGLCGAYNHNVVRLADEFLTSSQGDGATITACGRRGRDHFRSRGQKIVLEQVNLQGEMGVALAREMAADAARRFVNGEAGKVFIVYTKFRSAISHQPTIQQLLPITPDDEGRDVPDTDYLYEPDAASILSSLLPRYVDTLVFHAMLEATASEHGARMTAMDSASRNASDMIDRLTLAMNRARQATITTELMEIVGGAEALKG